MSKIAHPDAKTPISAIEFSSNNDLFQSILYKLKSILLIANTKNTKINQTKEIYNFQQYQHTL